MWSEKCQRVVNEQQLAVEESSPRRGVVVMDRRNGRRGGFLDDLKHRGVPGGRGEFEPYLPNGGTHLA